MVGVSARMKSLPTWIDRYPGKMVSHLAENLIDRYASDTDHLLDPFCGSGAIISAGSTRNIQVSGIDINPFGVLLSRVKIEGFDSNMAKEICEELLVRARDSDELPLQWNNKSYWFTPATLRKYQQLRFVARGLQLDISAAGRAVLLALGLSVRPCSRADQRSPKPFISQEARSTRKGKHFDPRNMTKKILSELCARYGRRRQTRSRILHLNVVEAARLYRTTLACSLIITSPPYVNAQDYFRNSKLELYVLEDLLPFRVNDVVHQFVGTERKLSASLLSDSGSQWRRDIVPQLRNLEEHSRHKAMVVHRYIRDMKAAFWAIRELLHPNGMFVLVCGDNLVGGMRIITWRYLNAILEGMGFTFLEKFEDRIRNRALAPHRKGHKGLIKQEVISAFRLR